MKFDLYLVKDDNSTITTFRCHKKAMEYIENKHELSVEKIEIELPSHINNTRVKPIQEIKIKDLDFEDVIIDTKPESERLEDAVNKHILDVYNRANGNKSETARRLGITIKTIYNKFNALGIK